MVGHGAAFAFGILAAKESDCSFLFTIALIGFFFLAISLKLIRKRNASNAAWKSALLLYVWLLAGMFRMICVGEPARGSVLDYEGKRVTVHGTIIGVSKLSASTAGEWSVRYEVALDNLIEEGERQLTHSVSGGAIVTVRQQNPLPEGEDGDSLTAVGNVRTFHVYHNPGQPDWAAALAARGLNVRISAASESLRIVRRDGNESLTTRLNRWRSQARAALTQAMPDKDAALIMGMLFGGYDGIERQTVRDFATTGIVHILSVSGAHIALVAGAIFWLSRRLSAPESWGAGIAATAMVGYGIISGFSAPVIRSVIMGLVVMAAIGSGRVASASSAMTLAAFGMLLYEPRNLFDISFQLSIGCTAGLLFLHHRLAAWMDGAIPKWAAEGVAATMAAQLAVIPLLSWYFGVFPIISLFANILVVPILEAVILLGLFGILMAGGFSAAAHPLFAVLSLLTGLAVEINRFLAKVPGGAICLPAMGIGSGFVYYGALLWIAGSANRWRLSPRELLSWLQGRPRHAAILGLIAVGITSWSWLRPGPLQVHFIDVGQGDATLIITPHGRTILVDAGGTQGAGNGFDIGERVVVPYLRHYGVDSIDWLILTHNHQDHAGGAAAVAEILGVRQVLLRQPSDDNPASILRLQQAMHDRGLQETNDVGEIRVDGLKIQLFQAGEDNLKENAKGKGGRSASENGRSNVARFEFGKHSFLVTGDMEGESEKKLCKTDIPPSTVLKVGHHGSRKSTQSDFLARITPQYAVISVGADNQFGHPAPETLHRLQEWPVSIFRTDRDGAVVFRSDGENLTVEKTVH